MLARRSGVDVCAIERFESIVGSLKCADIPRRLRVLSAKAVSSQTIASPSDVIASDSSVAADLRVAAIGLKLAG